MPFDGIASSAGPQLGLFGDVRPPVLAAWGAGVDSTAMLIEMVERGDRVDQVLFADTGAERQATYDFIPVFIAWLAERGIPTEIVRYQAKNFKNFPAYRTLTENVLTNGTLPGISMGAASCSAKWKQIPQDKWTKTYEPAQRTWAAGGKVIKLIGYDSSPADNRRYAARDGVHEDEHYIYRYPLREWGWTRADCEARIARAGLPVPPKSSCFFCLAMRPSEVSALPVQQLRQIVLIEARAAPRLKTCEGLWRSTVKGCRGATPRPGSMTTYIRDQGLLPADEVAEIQAMAPEMLTPFRGDDGNVSTTNRPELGAWLRLFDMRDQGLFDAGRVRLFDETATPTAIAA